MGPFEVTKELVSHLDDTQLRELLEYLLIAEANTRGIPHIAISVGGNQTAGDGGVDASIGWTGAPEPADWLPRRLVYFQCKAEAMGPAKLRGEMRPDDQPRPIFPELANAQGAYIIFSTDDPSKSAMDNRLAAMATAVAGVESAGQIHLDFYGADRIARWANLHPGVAIWLLGQSGRSLGGWRRYGDWSAIGATEQVYLIDETGRVAIDETMMDTASAIDLIRANLAVSGGVVRLVGLSGMGKTRMAEALFDTRLGVGALPQERAIYGDAGRDLETGAARLTEELLLAGAEAIIVVDNANARIHAQLAEIVRRQGSRLSLLTIDYDIGGEKLPGLLVTLGENSEEILLSLLRQRMPSLSEAECRHLAAFSGGNARIALKIAEGAGKGIDLSTLSDAELLERLFQSGRQERDPQVRASADAASLVYAFYVEAGDQQDAEHPVLASIAGNSQENFYRHVATLLDWGVVQQRGPQRAVMPPPFANMLAAPFIRRSEPKMLLERFTSASPRLLSSFARRLGQLHNEPAAVRLAEALFVKDAPFGEPAILDDTLRRGFVLLAPAAPEAALAALERSLLGGHREALLDPSALGRRDYLQLLVHIAHEPALFARCMQALLAFTLADGDAGDDRQARKHFLERFWVHLSFTLANDVQRLACIDRLLDDPSDDVKAVGLEALDHMLEAGHFNSSLNIEFGARARLTEWRPSNPASAASWFGGAYERVLNIMRIGGRAGERAKEIIANHFRNHLDAGLPELAIEAVRRARGGAYWDAGWRAVNDGVSFSADGVDRKWREEVITLERELRPRTLDDCFAAFVLGEPWRHWHPARREKHLVRNVAKLAEAVGVCLVRNSIDLTPYLAQIVGALDQNSAWAFGKGLGRATENPTQLWQEAYGAFAAQDKDRRNPRVLSGIVEGAQKRGLVSVEPWLDAAITDPLLAEHIVLLQLAVTLDAEAMTRLRLSLAHGVVPIWQYSNLQIGGVTKPVPAEALVEFLTALYEAGGGVLPAVQILHMRIFGDKQDKRPVDRALQVLGRKFLADPRTFAEENESEDHGIATIAKDALTGDGANEAAAATCRALISGADAGRYRSRDFGTLCKFLIRSFPRVVLDEIVAKEARESLLYQMFGGPFRDDDQADEEKFAFDLDAVIDWVRENPEDRAPSLAKIGPYFAKEDESGLLRWSGFALALIAVAPDPSAILRTFEDRFFTGSSSGPLSARFVRRRPLVSAMLTHENPNVRNWARLASQRLEENILRWDERDRDRESRFE